MKISLRLLILSLFILFIPIDMINGVIIRNGLFSVSPIYKVLVLALCVFYIIKHKQYFSLNISIIVLIFYITIYLIVTEEISESFKNLDMIIKFISIFIFYQFFNIVLTYNNEKKLFLVAKVTFWVLVVNTLIGMFGYGYPMYGTTEKGIGTVGLIYAGNELGVAVIVTSAIYMMYLIENKSYIHFLSVGFILLIMSVAIGSKVTLFGGLVILFIFPLLKMHKNMNKLKISKKDFVIANINALAILLSTFVLMMYILFESDLGGRINYFYERVDLITLLFSNRNIWALEALEAFSNLYSIFDVFFGSSFMEWSYVLSHNKRTIEIDFFDFLMLYGLTGVVVVFGILLSILWKVIKNRKNNFYSSYVIFLLILLFAISFTAGHTFNSGTAGFLIAILLSIGNLKNKVEYHENSSNL